MEKMQKIRCSFANETALYSAYMPFVIGGGIFIRNHHVDEIGEQVSLSIKLMDEEEPYEVMGKVIWITPKGAQGNKVPGIGAQFIGENSRNLCNKIETYLAGMIKSNKLTDTM
ncbi:MAG: PilZ domain-containing protein [Legionella longbeachae]|nr:PilZ domain-containing protein [Legionella longbeachae]